MKKLVRKTFGWMGLEISRKRNAQLVHDYSYNEEMGEGLKRCHAVKPDIRTIVDVGAAAGTWSLSAVELWQKSDYLLFEPLHERKTQLEKIRNKFSGFHLVTAAAGKEKGELTFYVAGDLDGSGVAGKNAEGDNIRKVQVTSIDEEISKQQFKGPYLVKLDTHGFEVPILEGCKEILPEISVFIIECYGFQIASESLLFWEMCQYMDRLGFRVFDIVDVMRREKDGAFWQCDTFFLRKNDPVFNNSAYN